LGVLKQMAGFKLLIIDELRFVPLAAACRRAVVRRP
jgi:hypothetical protein